MRFSLAPARRSTRTEAQWIGRARQLDPAVSQAAFLRSFPFAATGGREMIERALHGTGL